MLRRIRDELAETPGTEQYCEFCDEWIGILDAELEDEE